MLRGFEYTEAYRQGEILIFKLSKRAGKRMSGIPRLKIQADGVIREGEESGHEHKVVGDAQLKLFPNHTEPESLPEEGVIEVGKEGATVTHPEHKDIKLEPGTYAVKTQKEAKGKHSSSSVKD